jgi:glycosyltransferase involved in cell wall biosynthesis
MATYNGEQYLKQQLESILCQLSEDDELVISDDASQDKTLDIIKDFQDQRIRLLVNQERKGVIKNFENALRKAAGDVIYLADQDDIWEKNKVQVVNQYIKDYDCVVSNCTVVDEQLNVIHESFFELRNSGKGLVKNLFANTYLGCCITIRRRLLNYVLPFPAKIPMHDIWIGVVAETFGIPLFIPNKLVKYRRHQNTATLSARKSRFTLGKKIIFRLNIIGPLLRRNFIADKKL